MKEIFQEYGGIIITIVAIIGLLAVVSLAIGGKDSALATAFSNLIETFISKANSALG